MPVGILHFAVALLLVVDPLSGIIASVGIGELAFALPLASLVLTDICSTIWVGRLAADTLFHFYQVADVFLTILVRLGAVW